MFLAYFLSTPYLCIYKITDMEKYTTETSEDYSLVDNWTGEIKELKIKRKVSYDEFIFVFLNTIPRMNHLEGNQLKVLLYCWKYSSFNPRGGLEGNLIYTGKLFKNNVRRDGLGMSDGAIDLYICQLNKLGLLIKQARGVYMLNPNYFFKGTISDATKLQLTVTT